MSETENRLPWYHPSYRPMYMVVIICGFLVSGISSAIYHWNAFSQGRGKFGDDEVVYLFLIPAVALAACIFFRNKIQDTRQYPLARLALRITLTIECWVLGGTLLIFVPIPLVFMLFTTPRELPEAIGFVLAMYLGMAIMGFPVILAIAFFSIGILRILVPAPIQIEDSEQS